MQDSAQFTPDQRWALKLFERSVLKQDKFRAISGLLGDTTSQTCLDIGANNGVISLLLRQRGGQWHSADLEAKTVASIRQLVGERVLQIDGKSLPFEDDSLDLVVIVDFLEHIPDDAGFVFELARVLRPGGALVINVPHIPRWSLLNPLRHLVGLTDQRHGHLRPGYTAAGLSRLLAPHFSVERVRTYSKTFSEGIDSLLSLLYMLKERGQGREVGSAKGIVLDQDDISAHGKEFRLLSLLYPFIYLISRLDRLLFFTAGYKMVLRAKAAD